MAMVGYFYIASNPEIGTFWKPCRIAANLPSYRNPLKRYDNTTPKRQLRAQSSWSFWMLVQGIEILALLLLVIPSGMYGQSVPPVKLFQEALVAQQRGESDEAVRQYRELLRMHPDADEARVNLGTVLTQERHFEEAIAEFCAVLAHNSNNREARRSLAVAYEGNGNLADATHQLESLHNEDPNDSQTTLALARSYVQTPDHPARAIALLTPLATAHPEDQNVEMLMGKAMVRSGRLAEGVELLERVAERSISPEAYLLAGQAHFAMSQFDLARIDGDDALRVNPHLQGLAALRGMIAEQMADYEEAEVLLQQAVLEDPGDFTAHLYLGANFYFRRDLLHAEVQLQRALELQPSSAQARYELALAQRAAGREAEALTNLELVVRQMPDWLQPHVELSALYYRMHRTEDGARQKDIVDRMMAALQQIQSQTAH